MLSITKKTARIWKFGLVDDGLSSAHNCQFVLVYKSNAFPTLLALCVTGSFVVENINSYCKQYNKIYFHPIFILAYESINMEEHDDPITTAREFEGDIRIENGHQPNGDVSTCRALKIEFSSKIPLTVKSIYYFQINQPVNF